jgi:beta-lactamase regulating signal transducer with metallopeptidase domain
MMSPITWLSRDEVVALGWTLLHFCWQGTAVAVAFAAVDRITSRASSRIRYSIALAALLLMPAIVLGTFALEIQAAHAATPAHLPGDANTVFSITPSGIQPLLHELPLASSLEEPTNWLAMRTDRMLPWVDAIWFLGVVFLALRSLGGWWHLGQVRRHARRMIPQEIEHAFLQLCDQIEVGRKVVLRASDEVISPMAMGVWRATVILPISAVLSLPRAELEAVIAHELGHIRRWDYLWNLLQTAIESLLFFHPAVWWISRTVRERREICCDEIAVRSCSDAAIYARALLRLEEQRTVKLRLAMALGGCGGSLLGRVRKILGEDMAMEGRMTSGVSVAAIGALALSFLLGPKISEAVATPAGTHPMLSHVLETLPAAVISQIDTPNKRIAVPAAPVTVPDTAVPPIVLPDGAAPPLVLPDGAATPIVLPDDAASAIAPAPPSPAHHSQHAAMPMIAPSPSPHIHTEFAFSTAIVVNHVTNSANEIAFWQSNTKDSAQGTASSSKGTGAAYLDGMRDAGYPLDLNNDLESLVALKSIGVTPDYAKSMGSAGLGKPTIHELITLKSIGVTPEYVASLKQGGIAPLTFHDAITYKSIGITPEYAAQMKQKGFGDLSAHELVTMKSLGVTPEYATQMKQAFGNLSTHELVTMKSLGVTPEYAAQMKQQGFGNDLHELISMKAQGMTPEYAGWLRQHFPQATDQELHRAAVFHLDDKFLADAKSHGFNDNNLDKLLKLKMSGLLNE